MDLVVSWDLWVGIVSQPSFHAGCVIWRVVWLFQANVCLLVGHGMWLACVWPSNTKTSTCVACLVYLPTKQQRGMSLYDNGGVACLCLCSRHSVCLLSLSSLFVVYYDHAFSCACSSFCVCL